MKFWAVLIFDLGPYCGVKGKIHITQLSQFIKKISAMIPKIRKCLFPNKQLKQRKVCFIHL